MEVSLPQILIILLSIKHLTSIHINCTINRAQLDYLTDGFECEISNNLDIRERNQQVESISGEFSEVQDDLVEYIYVEFGKFGESNLGSSDDDSSNKNEPQKYIDDLEDTNFDDHINKTVQIQSNQPNFNEPDEFENLKSIDTLKLAQDFENEENYEQKVKNDVEMDVDRVMVDISYDNSTQGNKNDKQETQQVLNKVESENLTKNAIKNFEKSSKKQRITRNVQENSSKEASILADLLNFRKNKSPIENSTQNITNLKNMEENLKEIQDFFNKIKENDEELFSESNTESNQEVFNDLNLTKLNFEDFEDDFENSTEYYAEDIENASELIENIKIDNLTAEVSNVDNNSSHLETKIDEITSADSNITNNIVTSVNNTTDSLNNVNLVSNQENQTEFNDNSTNFTTELSNDTLLSNDHANSTIILSNNYNLTSNFTILSPESSIFTINSSNSVDNSSHFNETFNIMNDSTFTILNDSSSTELNDSTIINSTDSTIINLIILDLADNTEENLENSTIFPSNSSTSTEPNTENSTILLNFSPKISPNFTINSTSINSLITYNNTIHYIPRGISDFFKNLKLLAILNSNLKEIRQIDLKGFPELRGLWLPYNDIEVIEWHLFDFNPKLTEIILMDNRIKIINVNAFQGVKHLEQLDLLRNVCVDAAAYDVNDTKLLIDDMRESCETEVKNLLENYANYFVICFAVIALLCTIIVLYACLMKFRK
ncbi:GATA zinc finger domain-containing protein 14-like [Chironomus tepperi]|uniref:GATA zinc finger domain-containing protein 14-like n=1 Tax=Chironomus tepperi TaxID=113505 RepID=UPI00391F7237